MEPAKKKLTNSWSNYPIPKELRLALKENGFRSPLPIQSKCLKASLIQNKHVLGAAKTGSGKTLAYVLPTLTHILTDKNSTCSTLKQRICNSLKKKEDFEMIDGKMMSVEDMIVDKFSDVEHEDTASESSVDTNSESESSSNTGASDLYPCPEAIVLVPTRELAFQVKDEFDRLCKHADIRTCCLVGGLSQEKQLRTLKKRPQVIIATPGRLYDIVNSDVVEHLNVQSVASVRTLIIDEADRMVQKGHFEELIKIIDILKGSKEFRSNDNSYRIYLYSATLTFMHEIPDRLRATKLALKESNNDKKTKAKKVIDTSNHNKKAKIKHLLNLLGIERSDTRIIDLNDETTFGRPGSEQLDEFKITCLAADKDLCLYYFLLQNSGKRTLIFCNSKDCLRRLTNVLKFLGSNVLNLHADMDQKKRLSSLEKFRQRSDSILVATDVAARGLDIKDLDCVVHYQVPKTCESYIHRSGRTARLFRKGVSLTLCEPKEAPYYKRLCNNINSGNELADYDVDVDLKNLLRERVELAQRCDKLDHQLRETKSNKNWFLKAAKECDIELDEEELRKLSGKGKSNQQNLEEDAKRRRQLIQFRKQLDLLLKRPLITKGSWVKERVDKLMQV